PEPPSPTLFPYTTLFRSRRRPDVRRALVRTAVPAAAVRGAALPLERQDRHDARRNHAAARVDSGDAAELESAGGHGPGLVRAASRAGAGRLPGAWLGPPSRDAQGRWR